MPQGMPGETNDARPMKWQLTAPSLSGTLHGRTGKDSFSNFGRQKSHKVLCRTIVCRGFKQQNPRADQKSFWLSEQRTVQKRHLFPLGRLGPLSGPMKKHRNIPEEAKFAYRGRNACPRCQTPIEDMKGPLFLHYMYYHCTRTKNRECSQKCVSGAELHRQIDRYLQRVQISERFRHYALKYLHELHEKESGSRNAIIQSQQDAYRLCLGQIDNLIKLKTSPANADGSLLSDEEYGRQRNGLLKEKAKLEELLADAGHRVNQWVNLSEETFKFACTARTRFANGDPKTKKQILVTIGSNLTLKDKILTIEAKKPFLILETSLSVEKPENGSIEPKTTQVAQSLNGANTPHCLSLLGDLEDVRTLEHIYKPLVKSIYAFWQGYTGLPQEIFPLWSWHKDSIEGRKK